MNMITKTIYLYVIKFYIGHLSVLLILTLSLIHYNHSLDVVDNKLITWSRIKCKILGYLDTKDEDGNHPKIIVFPIDKIDP